MDNEDLWRQTADQIAELERSVAPFLEHAHASAKIRHLYEELVRLLPQAAGGARHEDGMALIRCRASLQSLAERCQTEMARLVRKASTALALPDVSERALREHLAFKHWAARDLSRDALDALREECGVRLTPSGCEQTVAQLLGGFKDFLERPLKAQWPLVWFCAPKKLRLQAGVWKRHVFTLFCAVGLGPGLVPELLGIWAGEGACDGVHEAILGDLKDRGVRDVLFATFDMLSGQLYFEDETLWQEAFGKELPGSRVVCGVAQAARAVLPRLKAGAERARFKKDFFALSHAADQAAFERLRQVFAETWQAHPDALDMAEMLFDSMEASLDVPAAVRRALAEGLPMRSVHGMLSRLPAFRSPSLAWLFAHCGKDLPHAEHMWKVMDKRSFVRALDAIMARPDLARRIRSTWRRARQISLFEV
ncbi:MAG: transposase [Desulfovibrio sp.]|nr:transposase [Desulfovibrio sp.]